MSLLHYLVILLICTVAAALVLSISLRLIVSTAVIHSKYRIQSRPVFEPTTLDNLPITFRPKLGELIRRMQAMGFVAVANVTSREPNAPQQVTQCMLVNHQTGTRAAIFCLIIRNQYLPSIAFVNEYSDGTDIRTANARSVEFARQGPRRFRESLPREAAVEEMFDRHTTMVAAHAPVNAVPILPEPGKEIEFLTARHAEARAAAHPQRGFFLDSSGDCYRPTWKRALRMAAEHTPPFRAIFLWRARRRSLRNRPAHSAPPDSVASDQP